MTKIVFLCLLMLGFSAQAQSIGTAILVQGDASVTQNSQLTLGQTVSTGGNGYAFLRTQDGSLIIVRPNSSITIEDYDYRPSQPSENRMRYKLNYGVVRSISGEGLKANKSAYRMNTPMAAIGIRGTDFVVSASQNETLVSLNVGSVIVAPFSDQCLATSIGVCTVGATTLDISSAGTLAQVVAGSKSAVLVKSETAHGEQIPDVKSPPSSLEPVKGSQLIKIDRTALSEPIADALVIDRANQLAQTLEFKQPATPPDNTMPQPLPEPPAPKSTLIWGEASALSSAKGQLIAANADYGLYRTQLADMSHESGKVSFALTEAKSNYGEITDANLSIDFSQRRFTTSLDHRYQQINTTLKAVGDITQDGRLFSEWKQGTNMTVTGALGGESNQEAAYVFRQQVSNPQLIPISGIVHWQRQ